jgi:hypothetical protein
MYKSWWGLCFACIKLAFVASLDNMDAVMKQSGLEVPYSNEFLGSGHTRKVTTASTIVAIVQDSISFVDGKTSPKNSVDLASIENVFDEGVSRGPMVNASIFISRDMRHKILCTKVDDKVIVIGVIEGHEEDVFIGEILIDGGSFSI